MAWRIALNKSSDLRLLTSVLAELNVARVESLWLSSSSTNDRRSIHFQSDDGGEVVRWWGCEVVRWWDCSRGLSRYDWVETAIGSSADRTTMTNSTGQSKGDGVRCPSKLDKIWKGIPSMELQCNRNLFCPRYYFVSMPIPCMQSPNGLPWCLSRGGCTFKLTHKYLLESAKKGSMHIYVWRAQRWI